MLKSTMLAVMLLGVLLVFAGCKETEPEPAPETADTAHNARNALDWPGTYEGTLPCADCPGIETTLKISEDGEYELQMVYLERDVEPHVESGAFKWLDDNTRIALGQTQPLVFFVTEGRVVLVPFGETAPNWDNPELQTLKQIQSP